MRLLSGAQKSDSKKKCVYLSMITQSFQVLIS